jgi:hypothetical protein
LVSVKQSSVRWPQLGPNAGMPGPVKVIDWLVAASKNLKLSPEKLSGTLN